MQCIQALAQIKSWKMRQWLTYVLQIISLLHGTRSKSLVTLSPKPSFTKLMGEQLQLLLNCSLSISCIFVFNLNKNPCFLLWLGNRLVSLDLLQSSTRFTSGPLSFSYSHILLIVVVQSSCSIYGNQSVNMTMRNKRQKLKTWKSLWRFTETQSYSN